MTSWTLQQQGQLFCFTFVKAWRGYFEVLIWSQKFNTPPGRPRTIAPIKEWRLEGRLGGWMSSLTCFQKKQQQQQQQQQKMVHKALVGCMYVRCLPWGAWDPVPPRRAPHTPTCSQCYMAYILVNLRGAAPRLRAVYTIWLVTVMLYVLHIQGGGWGGGGERVHAHC